MVWGGSTQNSISHLHHEASISSRRSSIRPYQLGLQTTRESFPCMFLCGRCGYLCKADSPCPSCGKKEWIDLGYVAFAEVLRAREAEERRHPPERLKWRIRMASLATGGAIGLGGAAGLVLSGMVTLGAPLVVMLGGAAVALTHALGRHQIGRSLMAERVDHPTRWHVPLPLVRAGAKPVSRVLGPVRATGELLRAPFSGRMCVGYDVAVMFDAPGDAWPPIWVLREMHNCAFEVEDRQIAADAVSMALPITAVAEPKLTKEQQERFLRERGLFLVDGQFDLFETVVLPDLSYELVWHAAPAGAPPVLRSAPHGRAKDPYRG